MFSVHGTSAVMNEDRVGGFLHYFDILLIRLSGAGYGKSGFGVMSRNFSVEFGVEMAAQCRHCCFFLLFSDKMVDARIRFFFAVLDQDLGILKA